MVKKKMRIGLKIIGTGIGAFLIAAIAGSKLSFAKPFIFQGDNVKNSNPPVADDDLVNKLYADSKLATAIPKTYAELSAMIAGHQLVIGQWYILTDYYTKYVQPYSNKLKICEFDADSLPTGWDTVYNKDTNPNGCYEPLVLIAQTTSSFEKECFSTVYPDHALEYDFNENTISVPYTWGESYGNDYYYNARIHYDGNVYAPTVYNTWGATGTPDTNPMFKRIGADEDFTRPGFIERRTDTTRIISFPHDYKRMKFARFKPSYKIITSYGYPSGYADVDIPTYAGTGIKDQLYVENGKIYVCLRDCTIPNIADYIGYGYFVKAMDDEIPFMYGYTNLVISDVTDMIEYDLVPDFTQYREYYTMHKLNGTYADTEATANTSNHTNNFIMGEANSGDISSQGGSDFTEYLNSVFILFDDNSQFVNTTFGENCFNNTFYDGCFNNDIKKVYDCFFHGSFRNNICTYEWNHHINAMQFAFTGNNRIYQVSQLIGNGEFTRNDIGNISKVRYERVNGTKFGNDSTNLIFNNCDGNIVGNACFNCAFYADFTENYIGNTMQGVVAYNNFGRNIIGNYFKNNQILAAQGFSSNIIQDNMEDNLFDAPSRDITDNLIEKNFRNNFIYDNFSQNHIKGNFQENVIRCSFSNNQTEYNFRTNTFTSINGCQNNKWTGVNCTDGIYSTDEISSNVFGGNFSRNNLSGYVMFGCKWGIDCTDNTIPVDMRYSTMVDNTSYKTFTEQNSCTAIGDTILIRGSQTSVLGNNCEIIGNESFVIGSNTYLTGINQTFSVGSNNQGSTNRSVLLGIQLMMRNNGRTMLGNQLVSFFKDYKTRRIDDDDFEMSGTDLSAYAGLTHIEFPRQTFDYNIFRKLDVIKIYNKTTDDVIFTSTITSVKGIDITFDGTNTIWDDSTSYLETEDAWPSSGYSADDEIRIQITHCPWMLFESQAKQPDDLDYGYMNLMDLNLLPIYWIDPLTNTLKTTQDIEITDNSKGAIIKSPDGTRWRITVDNSGSLGTVAL